MRIGVAVDSACDLPAGYLARHGIGVLPINLYLGNEHLLDARDPQTTIDFYARYASKRQNAHTEPPTIEQIVESLLESAAGQVDRLLFVSVSSTRSKIFERVTEARLPLINAALQKRRREEIEGPFFMRVHDSRTLFTGQAVLVSEMVRLLRDEALGFDELCSRADELSGSICAYLIPRDLYYVRARARQKGENSVSWFGYQAGSLLNIKPIIRMSRGDTETIATARGFDHALEKLLEIAAAAIERGLKTNTVVLSYAGDPTQMSEHRLIREFKNHAVEQGVEVLEAIMSTTAGVNVGPGAISLAYAA